MQGKISEGIDFSDALARAVFIIGVPYPPSKDPKIINKQTYLNKIWNDKQIKGDKLDGRKWYLQQAIRAMNQAIGRVIRHKDDWGAVYLCDSRFNNLDVKNEISDWVKVDNGLKEFTNFPLALIQTKKFFDNKKQTGSECNPKKRLLISSNTSISEVKNIMFSKQQQQQDSQNSQQSQKITLKGKSSSVDEQNSKRKTNDLYRQTSIIQSIHQKRKELNPNNQIEENNEDLIQGDIPINMEIENQDENNDDLQQFLDDNIKKPNQQQCNVFNEQFLKSQENNGKQENNTFCNEFLNLGSSRKANPQTNKTNIQNYRSQQLNNFFQKAKQKYLNEDNQNSQNRIQIKEKTQINQEQSNSLNDIQEQTQMQSNLFQKRNEQNQIRNDQNQIQNNNINQDDQYEEQQAESNQHTYVKNQFNMNQNNKNINTNYQQRDNPYQNEDSFNNNSFSNPHKFEVTQKSNVQEKQMNQTSILYSKNYQNNKNDQFQQRQDEDTLNSDSFGQFKYNKFQNKQNNTKTFYQQDKYNKFATSTKASNSNEREQQNNQPKASQKCFICNGIADNLCLNKACDHLGCFECFVKQIKQHQKCKCNEECSVKDLKRI